MKLYSQIIPVSCREQLIEFKNKNQFIKGEIIRIAGLDGLDVYNPSVPIEINGELYIAGRVEKRESEFSRVMFFRENRGELQLCDDLPVFNLQDPFFSVIDNEIIFGGVRVVWEGAKAVSWFTDFYRGKSLKDLKYFTSGPEHMKDIRLVELNSGKIGIFSRPQGPKMLEKFECIAKIGFSIVDKLEDVTAEAISGSPLLDGQFLPDEWGGCNQIYRLKNGLLGVIGHKAFGEGSDDNNKILHYYSMAFAINSDTREMSQTKIICSRDCFPEGFSKYERLKDVTFTSGIIRNGDGTATLYSGLSDCHIGKAVIPDPFLEYE